MELGSGNDDKSFKNFIQSERYGYQLSFCLGRTNNRGIFCPQLCGNYGRRDTIESMKMQ